jgi:hypothetical protein
VLPRYERRESRMILTQSITIPTDAPATTTATGASKTICSNENFVTTEPTKQIAMTAAVMGIVRRQFTR